MKKRTLCMLAVFCLLLSCACFPAFSVSGKTYDAVITKYLVDINAGEDSVLEITEVITVRFNRQMHGIYRDIPLVYEKQEEKDGKINSVFTKANVSEIKGDNSDYRWLYNGVGKNRCVRIMFGNEDKYVSGVQVYRLQYKYDIGRDRNEGFDDFYFNIIGNKWEYPIHNVSFRVTMPKTFDKTMYNLTAGTVGSTSDAGFEHSSDGSAVWGDYNNTISPGQAVTIKIGLPDGYFKGSSRGDELNSKILDIGGKSFLMDFTAFDIAGITLLIAGAVFVLIALLLWFAIGRDDPLIETVEFAPPKNLTSAEAGYYIDGAVENRDILSLIIMWANKGYLTIHDEDNDSFSLTKVCDPEGLKTYEKVVFDKLFSFGETVSASQLKYNFSDTIAVSKRLVKKDCEASYLTRLYTEGTSKASVMIILFLLVVWMIATFFAFSSVFGNPSGIISNLQEIIITAALSVLPALPFVVFSVFLGYRNSRPKWQIIICAVACFLTMAATVFYAAAIWLPLWVPIIASVASAALAVLAEHVKKRTEFSNKLLGQLLGLKNFIETAEKDRLKALAEEDPSYFYNVLPYAYVLGVSDVWSKKLEAIATQPPSWYYSSHPFSMLWFSSRMHYGLNSYSQAMSARKSSSSSSGGGSFGGFGGGGFSGGGGGGGGGGGW